MVDLVNQRKKYFAKERVRDKRNKPMTQSQLKNLSFEEVKEEFDKQTKTSKRLKSDEAKDDKPTKKSRRRRKQIARKGLHTDIDKDDFEDSDEVGEQDDSVSGTKIPINHVFVAMK
ncbi:hypothetical protein Tco_1098083 [Tanacetum coccineum]